MPELELELEPSLEKAPGLEQELKTSLQQAELGSPELQAEPEWEQELGKGSEHGSPQV